MLGTILLLLLSALAAIAAIPLILKLVPPNEIYGVHTERALSRKEFWYDMNRFAGWAVVAAAACTVLALTLGSNTLLRPVWSQFAVFVLLNLAAAGAIFLYERQLGTKKKRKRPAATVKRPAVRRGGTT